MSTYDQHTPAQEQFLDSIKDLPTLPTVVAQVMITMDEPTSSARDLERLVANDQAIAARLIRLANSSFYGLPGKVTSLSRAITLLGFNTVRSLVLTIGVIDRFKGGSVSKDFDRGAFWEHSLSVSVASRLLASQDQSLNPDEVHIAGLLHDIGIMVMDTSIPKKFQEVLAKLIKNPGLNPRDVEREIIGLSHDEAGVLVAEKWSFPPQITEAIKYHHEPEKSQAFPEVAQIVCLANSLVHAFKKQELNGEDLVIPDIRPDLKAVWMPTPRHEELFVTKYEVDVEKVQDILALFK